MAGNQEIPAELDLEVADQSQPVAQDQAAHPDHIVPQPTYLPTAPQLQSSPALPNIAPVNLSVPLPTVPTCHEPARLGVTLPPHPPYSPISSNSFFLFPPASIPNLVSLGSASSTPLFARDRSLRASVITPNPYSNLVDAPHPDPYDAFGLLRSRSPSIEWDNYSEELQLDFCLDKSKLRIVSTDPNILDSSDQDALVDISPEGSEPEQASMEEIDLEISRLQTLRGNVLRRINMYAPDDVIEELVHEVASELKNIADMMDEYVSGVEMLLASTSLGESNFQRFQSDVSFVIAEVKKHKKLIQLRKKEVSPPPVPLTAFEAKSLEMQRESLALQKSAVSKIVDDKNKKGVMLAESKSNEFYGETSVMGDLLMEED